MVEAPAVLLVGPDHPLVLELLERRVDGAGARAPQALAALLELLHDLVAVARLLGQQEQHGGAQVAAPRLPAAEPLAERPHPRPAEERAAAAARPAVAAPAGHRAQRPDPAQELHVARALPVRCGHGSLLVIRWCIDDT
jgi:hypothetical protein